MRISDWSSDVCSSDLTWVKSCLSSQYHQFGLERAGLLQCLEDSDEVGRGGAQGVYGLDDLRQRSAGEFVHRRHLLDHFDIAVLLDGGAAAREGFAIGMAEGRGRGG